MRFIEGKQFTDKGNSELNIIGATKSKFLEFGAKELLAPDFSSEVATRPVLVNDLGVVGR